MSDKRPVHAISFFTAGLITTISITLVLFLLGLTFLVGFTAKGVTTYLKESLAISIQLSEDVDEATVSKIQKELDANPYVKRTVYITKEETKKQLVADLGRDPEEVLGYDPSNSYFDVYIKAEYINPDSIKLVEKSLKTQSLKGKKLIKNVLYDREDIMNANSNLSLIGSVLLALAIILILISFTLIRSIIQLNIYSRRFLINTMQLVGATNSFIRRPFVLRMVSCGIIAAVLANIAITGAVYYITTIFPISISIVSMEELLIIYVLVLLLGILITALATIFAVNRYLRMTTNNLYHV